MQFAVRRGQAIDLLRLMVGHCLRRKPFARISQKFAGLPLWSALIELACRSSSSGLAVLIPKWATALTKGEQQFETRTASENQRNKYRRCTATR